MSETLGNLVITLEANMVRFNQNMEDAARRTEQGANRMQSSLDMAKVAIVSLAGVATVGLLAGLVQGAIDAADNLRDMSMKTGIAVEDLNGLGFAAGQAGGSLESMVAAAGKLNKSIADAAGGGKETGAAFKLLGIDVTDASGELKKADVVMAEVADQFAKYQDGPEKAALALALFGKAGADMIPLLNEGGTALRENTDYAKKYSGMTTELANMSDEFNDSMGKLTLQQKSFGNILAEAVLPAVNAVAAELLGAAEKGDVFTVAAGGIRTVLETIIAVGADVVFAFKNIGQQLGGIAAQAVALASFDLKGFNAISEAMDDDLAKASAAHEKFLKNMMNRAPAVAPDGTPVDKPNAPRVTAPQKLSKAAKAASGKSDEEKAMEEATRLIAKLKEQSESYGLAGTALLSYQLAGSKMPESYKQQALALQTTIDTIKQEEEVSKKREIRIQKEVEDARRAGEQNAANVDQIRASLMSEAQAEDAAHSYRMEQLQIFHDAKLENEILANSLIEEETARHESTKAAMRQQSDQMALSMAANSASQLYSLMQSAGLEQTALGKALFIANKAIAVAEIIMNTEVGAAKALAMGPIIGPPLAMAVRVMGYAAAGIVIGTTIASAEGGYDIPAGTNPVTQLHEKEMVLPKAQADVIRGLASGGAKGGGPNVTYSPQIYIDSRTDQAEVHRMVIGAVQQGNADLVEKLQRAGRI